ncbi:hypothetical protein SCOCK_270003 [Actinacidiphila cocklensis]|uniref:Uncharacterized protein n=1 Tax=Actinacidiphila cocklensis TaxID=887465 RepID=A0A9W4DUY9_9ACTN|nr:hypothetical protein SCOCK_270003 [Actinacidiphila cocklensis]
MSRPHADVQPQWRPDRAVRQLPRHLPRLRRAGGADPARRPVEPAGPAAAGLPRAARPARLPTAARPGLGRPAVRARARPQEAPRPQLRAHALLVLTTTEGRKQKLPALGCVDDTGIEPVTSSVSGKRSPAELIVLGRRCAPVVRARYWD